MKRSYFLLSLTALLILLQVVSLSAQELKVDSTFGTHGVMKLASTDTFNMSIPVFDFSNRIRAVHNAYDPSQAGLNYQGVIQFKSNGQDLDTAFSQDGWVTYTLGNYNNALINSNSAYDVKTIKDGRILVGGRRKSNTAPYVYHATVTCLKSNGVIDSSFATNGRFVFNHLNFDARVNDIHQNRENDALRIHSYASVNEHNYILGLKLNGTLDSSFGTQGKAYWHHVKQPAEIVYNHKPLYDATEAIYIYRNVYDSASYTYLRNEWLKLKPNGQVDSTFGVHGIQKTDTSIAANSTFIFPSDFQTNCIDKHGNLFVFNIMKTSNHQALLKYKPNGLLDSTFANNGIYDIPSLPDTTYYNDQKFYCSAALQDGSIIIAGDVMDTTSINKIDGAISRITYTGATQQSFFDQGYFYRDLNNYNQDGFREIHTTDSVNYYFCGTAHKSALNYAQFYLAFKMNVTPYALTTSSLSNPLAIVYPNPCNDQLHWQSEEPVTSFALYTLNGQCVVHTEHSLKTHGSINMSHVPEGLYILGLQRSKQWYYHTIQVQH